MRPILTVISAVLVIAGTGCTAQQKPPGLPELVPCKIQVLQGGEPLANADVTLIPVDPTGTVWSTGGRTNEAGIAEMRTYGQFVGAPVDQYKVIVTKIGEEVIREEDLAAGIDAVLVYYDLVDPELGSPPTTTLQILVEKGTVNYSIDVGAPVRILRPQSH